MVKKFILAITVMVISFTFTSCDNKAQKIKEAEQLHQKAWNLVEEQKYDEAMVYFDKALELDPANGKIWFNRGNNFVYQKKYKEALECFDKAIELEPENNYFKINREIILEYVSKDPNNTRKK